MAVMLDYIGSYVIGGMILLILFNVNSSVQTASSENLYAGIMQKSVTTAAEIIEYDAYKIGYRVSGNKFSLADSNAVKFQADLDDNGTAETVHYYCGNTAGLTSTSNPNDFILNREINSQKPGAQIFVSNFVITYFDSLGQVLNYAALTNQSEMNKIRSIKFNLKCESDELIDGAYEAAEWEKIILPKNI
jgi:hypothetical protein